MNEAPGLPTPTLPGSGGAATPPEVPEVPTPTPAQPFSPPTQPMADAPPPADSPMPEAFGHAGSSQSPPSLPPVGNPVVPMPPAAATGDTPLPQGRSAPSGTTPPSAPKQRNSAAGKILPILLLGGAAALGYVGYTSLTSESSPDDGAQVPATAAPAPTSPLVAPINDAELVVDDINNRPEIDDALADLGLDPTGEPTAQDETTAIDALTFTYTVSTTDASGGSSKSDYLINVETGDFGVVQDGVEVRRVDGVFSERLPDRSGWKVVDDDVAPDGPLGIDGVPTSTDVLPPEMLSFVLTTQDDGIAGASVSVDEVAFQAAEPAAWASWNQTWGLGSADRTATGTVRVFVKQRPDGSVHRATIESEQDGWAVDYEHTSWLSGSIPIELN